MGSGSSTDFVDGSGGQDAPFLRRRVAELENLLGQIDGIVWTAEVANFRYRYVSLAAERLLGYPVGSWTEQPEFWLDHLHPADREWVPGYRYSAAVDGQEFSYEFRMIASDGSVVWFNDFVRVDVGEDGKRILCGLMVDVSENRRADDRVERRNSALYELARSEALKSGELDRFLRMAMRVAAETLEVERIGVWLFEENRSILRCRCLYEHSLARYTSGLELQAQAYPHYFSALSDGRFLAADDALSDPRTEEFAEGYLRPYGITSMLDAPLLRGAELLGVVCHEHVGVARRWLHDEREFAASVAEFVGRALESRQRRQAEEAVRAGERRLLEQQTREKKRVERELADTREELIRQTTLSTIGQIAAGIAHELRNPLGAIRNATFYLENYVAQGEERWMKHLGIIDREVQAADGIIGDLLEMTRAKTPETTQVDLASAVTDAIERLPFSNVRVDLSVEPDPFQLRADEEQLRRVFFNLLLNAAQAMSGRGAVRVRATRRGSTVQVVVDDEGPGIGAADRGHVFEPLFTTKAKGTGLGLPICRRIVEGHGGTIEVIDRGSPGARFVICLPAETAGQVAP